MLSRLLVAQCDRPLPVNAGSAPAWLLTMTAGSHVADDGMGLGTILSRGLLEPHQRLLVVHIASVALAPEHGAELILAGGVTPLGADLVRHHRPLVVDRHALAEVVDATDGLRGPRVALRGGCRTN